MEIFGRKIQSPFVNKLNTKSGSVLLNGFDGNEVPHFINPYQVPDLIRRGISLSNFNDLSKIYHTNPIINAALNVNARYLSNVEVKIKDLSSGIIYSKLDVGRGKTNNKIVEKMFNLINEPNPLQSTDEFLKFLSITHDTHGNSMIRGNFAFDRIDIENIQTMFCLWPQFAKPIMTKKYWNATDIKGIIDHWEYNMFGTKTDFSTDEILHRKEANISINKIEDLVMGRSKLTALERVISTIDASYDARETIANEKGANLFIGPDKNDPFMGSMDLTPKERTSLEAELQKKYGLKHDQLRTRITDTSVKFFQPDQDVRKLGIVEEIGLDTMITAHILDIPPELIKMYKEGATYENQSANERIMYQSNSMPKAESIFNDINNWLGVRKKGFEYVTSWDHIAVLQENKRQAALIKRDESFVCREAFNGGAINRNEWRIKLGFEKSQRPDFEKTVDELDDRTVQVLTGRNQQMAQNENKPAPDSSSQI